MDEGEKSVRSCKIKKNLFFLCAFLIVTVVVWHAWRSEDSVYKMKPAEFGTTEEFADECWNAEEKTVTAENLSKTGVLTEVGPYQLERGSYQFMVSYNTDTSGNYCEIISDAEMDKEGTPGVVYASGFLDPDKEGILLEAELPEDAIGVTLQIHYSGGLLKVNQIEFRSLKHYTDTPVMYAVFLIALFLFGATVRRHKNGRENQLVLFLLMFEFLYISLPLLNDFLVLGHDAELHLGRIRGMYYALRDKGFPMWINPFQGDGYGYASSVMYPQLFLWIPALLMWAGVSLLNAYKLFLLLINFFTVLISFYSFRMIFRDKVLGLLTGMFYCMSLYRMSNVYTRGALGEFLAMAFLPLLVLGLYQVVMGDYRCWHELAWGGAGILSSHVLSTYLYGLCSVLFVLGMFGVLLRQEPKKRLLALLKAGAELILLGVYFLIPFLSYSKESFWVSVASNMEYTMQEHGVYFSQMFATFVADGGSSLVLGTTKGEMPLTVGGISLLILLVSGALLIHERKSGAGRISMDEWRAVHILWIAAVLSLFMSSWLFPWVIVEKLSVLGQLTSMQFPWRMMGPATICVALLLGFSCKWILDHPKYSTKVCGRFGLILLVAGLIAGSSLYYLDSLKDMRSTSTMSMSDTLGMSDTLYLYQGNSAEVWQNGKIVESSIEGTKIFSYRHRGDTAEFSYCLPAGTESAELTVPLYYYPGYRGYIDGEETAIMRDAAGRIVLSAEKAEGNVVIRFEAPWLWYAAYVISFVTMTVCIADRVLSRKRSQRICGGRI